MCSQDYELAFNTFDYNPDTGVITWKSCHGNKTSYAGKRAGSVYRNGYLYVRLNGRRALAHRVAWLLHYKVWPSKMIDHIDGNRLNNAINNLRDVDASSNSQNKHFASRRSASGKVGIEKRNSTWIAYIYKDGKKHSLGSFRTELEAVEARKSAKPKFHSGGIYV